MHTRVSSMPKELKITNLYETKDVSYSERSINSRTLSKIRITFGKGEETITESLVQFRFQIRLIIDSVCIDNSGCDL